MGLFDLFKKKSKDAKPLLRPTSAKSLVFLDVRSKEPVVYCFDFRYRGYPSVVGIDKYADNKEVISNTAYGFYDRDLLDYDKYKDLESYVSSMNSDEVKVVFVEPRLHIKTQKGRNLFADEDVSIMLNKWMSAEEIKEKYNLAVSKIDKEWIKSGKLKAINEQERAKIEEYDRKRAEENEKIDEIIRAAENEIKNEKLDITGHEKFFDYMMKEWTPKEAIRWAKLMQLEKRKNNGKLSKKIVNSTLKKAFGGDSPEDRTVIVMLEELSYVWKDAQEVAKYYYGQRNFKREWKKWDVTKAVKLYAKMYEEANNDNCETLINERRKKKNKEDERRAKARIDSAKARLKGEIEDLKNENEKGGFGGRKADRMAEQIIARNRSEKSEERR